MREENVHCLLISFMGMLVSCRTLAMVVEIDDGCLWLSPNVDNGPQKGGGSLWRRRNKPYIPLHSNTYCVTRAVDTSLFVFRVVHSAHTSRVMNRLAVEAFRQLHSYNTACRHKEKERPTRQPTLGERKSCTTTHLVIDPSSNFRYEVFKASLV